MEIFIRLVSKSFFFPVRNFIVLSFCFFSSVEILIRLLETEAFINNSVKTSWLDDLIAQRFQTEKPDITLAAVCGAIHVSDEKFRINFQNFRSSLER